MKGQMRALQPHQGIDIFTQFIIVTDMSGQEFAPVVLEHSPLDRWIWIF